MTTDVAAGPSHVLTPVVVVAERGKLRSFAAATGQTDPIYSDIDAARAAGHPDLPIPPTFYFSLELVRPDPFDWIAALGKDLNRVLHGEQSFEFHAMAYANEPLTLTSRIVDVESKRGGALELITKRTEVTRGSAPIATGTSVIVVRNGALV